MINDIVIIYTVFTLGAATANNYGKSLHLDKSFCLVCSEVNSLPYIYWGYWVGWESVLSGSSIPATTNDCARVSILIKVFFVLTRVVKWRAKVHYLTSTEVILSRMEKILSGSNRPATTNNPVRVTILIRVFVLYGVKWTGQSALPYIYWGYCE